MTAQHLALVPTNNADAYRASTDAAQMCKDIVVATSSMIQKRKYVSVEGWQAIAVAHGCAAGAGQVERIEGGVRAVGEVRRMSDGQLIASAEGFVGEDEPTWYGGEVKNQYGTKTLPKRPDYAIRAMAQTRAISRACRSAFAHVVVMMNAGLQTTPAEEVPAGGFDDGNVVEARPIPQADEAPPKPAEKLEGPYSSPSKLKAAIRAFAESLRVYQDDLAGFGAWMATEEVVELEKAALRYLPNWWETGEEMPEGYEPIASRIHRKSRELEELDSIANSPAAQAIRAG